MSDNASSTVIRRADYTPPAFLIDSVALEFDLAPARTIVRNTMRVRRNPDAAPTPHLELMGEALEFLGAQLDGAPYGAVRAHEHGLTVENVPDAFELTLESACAPDQNTTLSGLYVSSGNFFTQCEAEGFRRITYFLDRPDVMASYTATLRADKAAYPVLLSNGNLVEQRDLENGRHVAKWHDPFPKPSYLFALVAADLVAREQHIRTRAGKNHLLQVYVRRGDLDKTEHAMNSLVAAVVWDEARFGLALDLERFMIVAVGDFNTGAMENKGLNIFNTKYVLANPATATDADYSAIESVVGHEYFHNWTGNRITCRDWFQLSLKEGLTVFRDQEFSMDMGASPTARAVKRIEDVRMLRQVQFPEDAGPMAHPVRPDSYVQINNFYTATVYEKGAEVVRMMQTLIGREGFRRGMALYFERHDGQAVTCDDFAQAIADANPGSELATRLDAFKRWYGQAGTPCLTARGRYDAPSRTYTLSLEQAGANVPGAQEPCVIPVLLGLLGRDGRSLPVQLEDEPSTDRTERLLVVDQPRTFVTFVNVDVEPVPSLLRGFSAPVTLVDGLTDADLLVLLSHDPDPFNRWEAAQRLALGRLIEAVRGEETVALDDGFVAAMRGVLRDPSLDAAFKELVLTLPSEGYVAEQLDASDPLRIHMAREALKRQLATALRDDWAWAFETHQVVGPYSADAVSSGRRSLANLALSMLCLDASARADAVWPGRAYQRFKDAVHMTDAQGALAALIGSHSELAEPALERFFERYRDHPLVIDKWFSFQATAPERNGQVFERVKALLRHPDFTLSNPNRIRSLVGAFCMSNPAAFHRADAGGYQFWADRVLELDGPNPQMAARIARVMDRWTKLAEPYRAGARDAINRVAAHPDLSSDVREIVTRALLGC